MTAPAPPAWLEPLGHGIYAIDTGFERPHFDAAYLLVEQGRAVFVDTGANAALPRLLEALAHAGVEPAAVEHVIVTHVHLDHAGGAGLLMQHLPRATLVVHPRGARHMRDPKALVDGARAVYGTDVVTQAYGDVQPVPAHRVLESHDGMVLTLAERTLTLIDTPGHAKHHHCVWDARSRGWFTGDTFGLSYPECDAPQGRYLLPTSSPVQFDPDALRHSVGRLLARHPTRMYLTHFGCVTDVPHLANQLLEQVDAMVAIARPLAAGPDRHARLCAALSALYRGRLQALGSSRPAAEIDALLSIDVELNAQGLAVWLDRSLGAAHGDNGR